MLAPLVDVQILYFENVPAKDDAFVHCNRLLDIRQIQIRSCSFSGVGPKHFANAKQLKCLFIEDSPITDDGLSSIATLTNLEVLDISCLDTSTEITMTGSRRLQGLKALKQLSVTMPKASQDLENELKSLFPQCKHVDVFFCTETQD